MGKHARAALLLAGSLLAGSFGSLRAQAFCEQIKTLVADPTVASAHWGIAVTALDGTPLCGVNEAQLFRPASNNKIFTTATALALLGPDKRFTTQVVGEGEIKGGILHGDLKLIGGGDANFGSHNLPYIPASQRSKNPPPEPGDIADIESLADQIVAKGVRSVQGNVIGADGYFAWQPYPPDWSLDDAVYGYGAPISALTIHDNQIVVQLASNPRAGGLALLKITPEMPYYVLSNHVEIYQTGQDCDAQLQYQRAPGAMLLKVFGAMAPGAPPCVQDIAIQDPAEYAAMALKAALERRGVHVTGKAKAQHFEVPQIGGVLAGQKDDHGLESAFAQPPPQPVACSVESNADAVATRTSTELATHSSPTLIEDLTYTNKVSQNLHAELLLRNVGSAYCQHTQRGSLHVVRQYLLHAGLEPNDFVLYDGSGLSGHDLVAPRALAKFLSFAAAQPWFKQWKATLPEGGVDGGLATRYATTLKGRIFAKTGTLSEARALSGYATAATGQTVIFSVMVDTHLPGTGADRVVMDKIVEAIAAGN
jgi:D-alanyl-D-alanine carboxypeptidase/D-alanyl-D-alanine-endopeptidase (penicillin-binding protein 4)